MKTIETNTKIMLNISRTTITNKHIRNENLDLLESYWSISVFWKRATGKRDVQKNQARVGGV